MRVSTAPAVALLLLSAAVTPPAHALGRKLSLDEIVQQGKSVLVGTVTCSSTRWGEGRKMIWTDYEVAVEETWKGSPGTARDSQLRGGNPGRPVDRRDPRSPARSRRDLRLLAERPRAALHLSGRRRRAGALPRSHRPGDRQANPPRCGGVGRRRRARRGSAPPGIRRAGGGPRHRDPPARRAAARQRRREDGTARHSGGGVLGREREAPPAPVRTSDALGRGVERRSNRWTASHPRRAPRSRAPRSRTARAVGSLKGDAT